MAVRRAFLLLLLGSSLPACPAAAGVTTDTPSTTTEAAGLADGSTGTSSLDSTTGTTTTTTSGELTTTTLDVPGSTTTTSGTTSTGGEPGDTSTSTGESTSEPVEPVLCGNGVLDPGEVCDDGDADDTDLCRSDCHLGPGDKGEVLAIPPLLTKEALWCFTAIGPEFLAGPEPALVLGSAGWHVIADEYATRLRQLPLPSGAPVQWTWAAGAGQYGREAQEAATAANGDIIVSGLVWTEIVKPDTGGYLWLARFTPAGALVWSHDFEHEFSRPADMELTPAGDIVVVGNSAGFAPFTTAEVHVFDPNGEHLWTFAEDKWEEPVTTRYTGVTVDADGAVYVVALRADSTREGKMNHRIFLRALAPDGAPLWTRERLPPEPNALNVGDITLAADQLVVSAARYHLDDLDYVAHPEHSLVAFDAAGDELWWKNWAVPAPWGAHAGGLVAAPDGGVFLIASASAFEDSVQLIARFDAEGDDVWAKLVPGKWPRDALLAPDGRLYVLSPDEVTSYAP